MKKNVVVIALFLALAFASAGAGSNSDPGTGGGYVECWSATAGYIVALDGPTYGYQRYRCQFVDGGWAQYYNGGYFYNPYGQGFWTHFYLWVPYDCWCIP